MGEEPVLIVSPVDGGVAVGLYGGYQTCPPLDETSPLITRHRSSSTNPSPKPVPPLDPTPNLFLPVHVRHRPTSAYNSDGICVG